MRLASAVFGFVLRKLGLFAALILSLFVSLLVFSAVFPVLQQAEADRERLEKVAAERQQAAQDLEELVAADIEARGATIDAEINDLVRAVSEQGSVVDDLRAERDDDCGRIRSLVERLPYVPDTCEAKQAAYDAARGALQTFERNRDQAREDAAIIRDPDLTFEQKRERLGSDGGGSAREIDTAEADLAQLRAEEKGLERAQGSWAGRVVDLWARSWRWLAGIALLVIVMPVVLRTVGYFLLMPLVKRAARPLRLASESEHGSARVLTTPARRTLVVSLAPGEVLSARSEHVRPVRGRVRSRLLYDWTSPFVSFAAGLYGLSRATGVMEGTEASLATPDDPDSYLMRIDFVDHPGIVMRPRHVVGVIGTPTLKTRWHWGIQSFATWQVRYIMFAGTGSLIVQGSGDVVATSPGHRSTRIEQHLVMGFDSRLAVGVDRTEVFWPYLWGRTPLVDDDFIGPHPLLWQKASAEGTRNPVAKTLNAFFSSVGKLLGF